MTEPRKLRLLPDVLDGDPEYVDAWRVEVWVSTYGSRPWLASSAITDSIPAARVHASQAVSGLLVDGIDPAAVFVGAILGKVLTEHAGNLDPGWAAHPGEPVSVAVIDDGGRLGMWLPEPEARWRARTCLPEPPTSGTSTSHSTGKEWA